MPPSRKYAPLNNYLAALPREQDSVQFTLAEIGDLLGMALPASAWTTAFWTSEHVARSNWRQQDWHAVLNRPLRSVTFRRGAGPQAPPRLQQTERDAISAAYRQGLTITALAHQFGVTSASIHNLLRRAGVPRRPRASRAVR